MKSSLASKALRELSGHIDSTLADQLFSESEELETSFALHKWKHTQLDGGRFCEVASRIIYSVDSGTINLTKSVETCINYIENDHATHLYPDRQALNHIVKVIKSAYKLRSQRGAVHVTPKYTADEIDSRYILECCRWILADILRLFAGTTKKEVAELIQELAQYPVPLVREYGERKLLQSVAFTTEEEVLVLLYFGPKEGMPLEDLLAFIPRDNSGIRRSVKSLTLANKRQVILVDSLLKITDLGIRRAEDVINSKELT